MALAITEKAASEIKRVMQDQFEQNGEVGEEEVLLRVGVTGGGCSGMSYSLGFDKNYDELRDTRYDHHGVAVVIDKKSNLYLDGVTVDFFEDEQRKGFTFDNPNAAGGCCCG